MTFHPNFLARYVRYSADAYTETGAGGASLAVEKASLEAAEIGAGFDITWTHVLASGASLVPALSLGYRYDLVSDEVASTAKFTGGGSSFETTGFDAVRETFALGAGITYKTKGNWEYSLALDYENKKRFNARSGSLKASLHF